MMRSEKLEKNHYETKKKFELFSEQPQFYSGIKSSKYYSTSSTGNSKNNKDEMVVVVVIRIIIVLITSTYIQIKKNTVLVQY